MFKAKDNGFDFAIQLSKPLDESLVTLKVKHLQGLARNLSVGYPYHTTIFETEMKLVPCSHTTFQFDQGMAHLAGIYENHYCVENKNLLSLQGNELRPTY
mmetsp:Transcript_22663/g.21831  ORF Transcript_22663/g.21831 Transcript_22663/m.21831 type:complete len:100 (+) Transcript_22663:271-570(+)